MPGDVVVVRIPRSRVLPVVEAVTGPRLRLLGRARPGARPRP
jgi:hypothetical protein